MKRIRYRYQNFVCEYRIHSLKHAYTSKFKSSQERNKLLIVWYSVPSNSPREIRHYTGRPHTQTQKGPWMWSFGVWFVVSLNKVLIIVQEQVIYTPWGSCNVTLIYISERFHFIQASDYHHRIWWCRSIKCNSITISPWGWGGVRISMPKRWQMMMPTGLQSLQRGAVLFVWAFIFSTKFYHPTLYYPTGDIMQRKTVIAVTFSPLCHRNTKGLSIIVILCECPSLSNHRQHNCLFNSFFQDIIEENIKARVTGLLWGRPPVTDGFPS